MEGRQLKAFMDLKECATVLADSLLELGKRPHDIKPMEVEMDDGRKVIIFMIEAKAFEIMTSIFESVGIKEAGTQTITIENMTVN